MIPVYWIVCLTFGFQIVVVKTIVKVRFRVFISFMKGSYKIINQQNVEIFANQMKQEPITYFFGYGFSSSTMKFYTLPSFSQHDQCEFLTLPSFVQHSQKFLFTIVIQHTWFLHKYMWLFNITLFCPAFPNSFCLFTTTWLKGWKRR